VARAGTPCVAEFGRALCVTVGRRERRGESKKDG